MGEGLHLIRPGQLIKPKREYWELMELRGVAYWSRLIAT